MRDRESERDDMQTKAFFLSLEGIDGAGKSTQADLLRELFLRRGAQHFCFFREPGGTALGEKIRAILKDPTHAEMSAEAELLLFSAGRAQLCRQEILPALRAGKTVICDRFMDSTFAYQGCARGLSLPALREITEFATGGLKPDLTIYLDISPESAYRRLRRRNEFLEEEDRLDAEGLPFLRRVSAGYEMLMAQEPARFRRVSAEQSAEEMHREICELLDAYLGASTKE